MPISGRFHCQTIRPDTVSEPVNEQPEITQNRQQAWNQDKCQDRGKQDTGRQGQCHGDEKSGLKVRFQD